MRRIKQLIGHGNCRSTMPATVVASNCMDATLPAVESTAASACQFGTWRCSGSPVSSAASTASTARAAPLAAQATHVSRQAASVIASLHTAPLTPHGARGFAASAFGEGRGGNSTAPGAPTEVLEANEAARRVMEDPMSRLMASQGMPVGLSLGAQAAARRGPAPGGPEGDEEDPTRPPRAEPGYEMEAFSDMLRATAASARRPGGDPASDPSSSPPSSSGAGDSGSGGFMAGVQRVGPSLDDSWGTTRESPADIARRIVESNMDAERGGPGGLGGAGAAEEEEEDDDAPMALSPSEQKYASLEAMSKDIKKLDEVFEVLASVPWLDEDNLSEKELRGVAQFGLLGTLEEVGFNITPQLMAIWSGERGAELAAGPGLEFRDQAALMAILYHTQQIEDAYGPPPKGFLRTQQQGQAAGEDRRERK